MDRRLGYDFTISLTEAIAAAVALAGPGAFAYRGADLSHAVERQLFTKLVNDDSLYAAFEVGRRGGVAPPFTGSMLDRNVANLLLARSQRSLRALTAAARLLAWRRRAPRRRTAGSARWPGGPIAYLLDHPKFVRFVAPLIARDDQNRMVVLSAVDELEADGRVDYGSAERPLVMPGPGLRERDRLAIAFDVLTNTLTEIRPSCLVVIEGNSAFDEVANRAARALEVPTVCLQQGWSPIVHSGFRNMSFSRMAVWGDGFRRLLGPYNPRQHFDVTGNLAFAGASPPPPDQRRAVAVFLQSTSQLISEAHLAELLALVERVTERLPGTPVLVREHPGAPLSSDERGRLRRLPDVSLVPAETHSLREVIVQSRVAVSIYSTALLESAALLTPPVIFNPTSMPRFSPDLDALGAGVETRSADDAVVALERIVKDMRHHASFEAGMRRVRSDFFAGADGRAAERILELIRSTGH